MGAVIGAIVLVFAIVFVTWLVMMVVCLFLGEPLRTIPKRAFLMTVLRPTSLALYEHFSDRQKRDGPPPLPDETPRE